MRSITAVLVVATLFGRALAAQNAPASFVRLHLEADAPSATTINASVAGEKAPVVVEARPALDLASIARVYSQRLEGHQDYTVVIALTDAGKAAFAQATQARVGHRVVVLVDGKVTKVAKVNSALRGPLPIVSGLTESHAIALVDSVSAKLRASHAP